jgi:hypothetical protein
VVTGSPIVVNVRLAIPRDRPSIDEVEAAAFGGHADVVLPLIRELRRTEAVAFDLVAEIDDAIVGHVMVSYGRLDWPRRLVDVHVLSPIAVAVTVFPADIPRLPRTWIEDTYTDLIHHGEAEAGGHFAAFEQPEIMISEIRTGLLPKVG